MHCSKCNYEFNSVDGICPECGENNKKEQEISSKPIPPKRHMPYWFKIALLLTFIALVAVSGGLLFTETLINVPEKQLEALRENDIDKAYEQFTSKEFKKNASLEQFREFVKKHPILETHHSTLFPQRSISDHVTILKGKLIASDQSTTPIEYRLIKEDKKWKVLNLSLFKTGSINVVEKKNIVRSSKSLLKKIKSGLLAEAYLSNFSKEFKDQTSLEQFIALVHKYPLLTKQYEWSFHNPVIEEDQASLAINLKNQNDFLFLKISFIKEEDQWKIQKFNILSQ